ncbi:hypothetical protein [uncultured Paludibaculum sp.]|uniref:hypothetical protein n=1 Tax=uncultured Paludibaculum sp. TaxID=1765020 RepID=UPI002AAB7814|nr:hypothetical protein [uncultured Paludibaculum sp.]
MKKLGLILAVTSMCAFAGELTGYISETKCGAKHADASAGSVACVKSCISRGAKPVLVSDGKVVAIANADKVPAELYGQKVTVSGDVKDDALTIESIAAAK